MKSFFKSKRFRQHVFLICTALILYAFQLGLQYFILKKPVDWDLKLVHTVSV